MRGCCPYNGFDSVLTEFMGSFFTVGLWARKATMLMPILMPGVMVICPVGSFSIPSRRFAVDIHAVFSVLGWAAGDER